MPTRRALWLISAARPGSSAADLAALSLGQRNIALLTLRAELFGDRVEAIAACPVCHAELDVSFEVSALLASLPTPVVEPRKLSIRGYTGVLRPISSADVLAVLDDDEEQETGARLLDRCVTRLTSADGTRVDHVPAALAAEFTAELVRRDPAARVDVDLDCADCAHHWTEVLDVGGFVWRELDAWARRTMREVHLLAKAYGWREADILGMTPRRRAGYLQLVAG